MYNKILGTFSSKVYSSAIGFVIIILTSHYMGPIGRGEISLFIANLTLVQLFNEIIIGPALVFLVPRHKIIHLLFISVLWSFFISLIIVAILYLTDLSSNYLIIDLFYLSVLYALLSSSLMIIQGKQEIKKYNLINTLQSSILILILCVYLFVLKIISIESYIHTLYFAYSIPMFISLLYVLKLCDDFKLKGVGKEFIIILKTGFNAQISNFLNFLNSRISYYIIAVLYIDKSSLGIFALATSLVEAVWLVSYSIATIQYPIISSSDNYKQGAEISLSFSKITFWGSTLLILIMILIPEYIYLIIFGKGFAGIKEIILLLSPGIIVVSVSKIYWNYFSGLGKFKINNISGLIGLFCSTLSCYILIKYFGIIGAAYSTVATYIIISSYLFWAFRIDSGFTVKQLLPRWSDFKLLQKK